MRKLKFIDDGAYGSYYKISKRKGIKILSFGHDTKREAIEYAVPSVKHEYLNLVKASKRTKMVPRPYGVAIVKEYDKSSKSYMYHVGYVMSHYDARPLGDDGDYKDYDRFDKACDRMESLGIGLNDNHHYNVLLKNKRFIFIDAARFVVSETKKKRRKKHGRRNVR